VSLVEQAIAKLRQAAGAGKAVKRSPSAAMVRATTVAADNLEHTARNNRVLAIDSASLRANGYLPESTAERQFAEHYRQIKRPLVERAISANSRGDELDARIIMVTSALPGEGKTFTSINLAFSLARERDMSVLLVDADIPKPHISEIFGVTQDAGLMDALGDEKLAIESLVLSTSVKGLSILPAGRMAEGAAELLVSNRMRQILRRLLSENSRRIVLLDSPPLLATSEGRALVKVAGQVVLVVRAGYTLQTAVRGALAQIEPARMAGIVLNDVRLSLTDGYYGYGGYGSQKQEKNSADQV
jgi:protein-tyrosine kinase